jgi:hypothetical protein
MSFELYRWLCRKSAVLPAAPLVVLSTSPLSRIRRYSMRRHLLFVLAFLISQVAFADPFNWTGTINLLRAQEAASGNDHILLVNGFTLAGNCIVVNGLVSMRIKGDRNGDRMFVIALTAQALGKSVRVGVNDDFFEPGNFCQVRSINMVD